MRPLSTYATHTALVGVMMFIAAGFARADALVVVDTPMAPPSWAVKQQVLLRENARYMVLFAEKYVDPHTGYLECNEHWGGQDGPDDAMENFYNWPLVYTLGGPKESLDLFNFIWNGHIRQYTALGMYYREYITSFDWEHNGEGYEAFQVLPLSDPVDPRTRERFSRFADFYTGRDETVDNYDPEHRIIRSILNGSQGVKLTATAEDWGGHAYWTESGDWTRVGGDVTMNLLSTSMATNAFLLTGDGHFRDWVLEYAGAWADRAATNGGIIPSNIGLNGKVGEGWDGAWYGGLMGWNWVFGGFGVLNRAVRVGFGNAYFLSGGEEQYITPMRTLMDAMLENRKNGEFPERFNEEGWYNYGTNPLFGSFAVDLYLWTLADEDRDRMHAVHETEALRRGSGYEAGGEIAWIEFLEGKNPDYPDEALDQAFAQLARKTRVLRADPSTSDTRNSDTTHSLGLQGAATAALVELTMGGMQPLWSGGLLYSQLRYFDPSAQRPGLPEDIGALVTGIEPDQVRATLVNTCQTAERDVIVQGGAYGEHRVTRVTVNGRTYEVNDARFTVRLAPGAGADLVIERERFANAPTYAFPWHGGKLPDEKPVLPRRGGRN